MPYPIIQPPFTLKFREMPKCELKAYRQWFLGVVPERIVILESAVRSSPGFENWSADRSPASLKLLGDWFAKEVDVRARTPEEIEKIRGQSPFEIDVPRYELTNRTFSLSVDIGMYLGELFITQHPKLRWHQPLDNKRFADYGQLTVVGFGRVAMNPVGIAITLAYGIANRTQTGPRLAELYEYWSRRAKDDH